MNDLEPLRVQLCLVGDQATLGAPHIIVHLEREALVHNLAPLPAIESRAHKGLLAGGPTEQVARGVQSMLTHSKPEA